MIIQHNMAALFTNNQLNITGNNKSKTMEKLASGYKINRAADNAAGLTISEKLRTQIRGLDRSQMNIQDGSAYCNVADGALNEVHSMLDRLKELAVQAANDTYEEGDRKIIDKEVQQIKNEITNIFEKTNFNTINIWQAAYIPELDGACTDFSLYNVTDNTGNYFGGIVYMNRRYSWEDLGIGWDTATHTFTDTDTYKINYDVLHNDGDDTHTGNESGNINDDYVTNAMKGAAFSIYTKKDSGAADIEKYYNWSAGDDGIYVDHVRAVTWAELGVQPDEYVNSGTYSFNYYGMDISFEVPKGGDSWNGFIKGFNNPRLSFDWHTRYSISVSREVADITNSTNRISIDSDNKDNISEDNNPYMIHADVDGIWISGGIGSDLNKSTTLTRWEDIENDENYNIKSWGMNTDVLPGSDGIDNDGSLSGMGDQVVTFNSKDLYTYSTAELGTTTVPFAFDFKLLTEASRQAVIDDINNSYYRNLGVYAPTVITDNTALDNQFKLGSHYYSNISFLTQRDGLGREFNNWTENIATGVIENDASGYLLKLEQGSKVYSLAADNGSKDFIDGLNETITNEMENLYNTYSTMPVVLDGMSLNLGKQILIFENSTNNVSLELDLSHITYGDIMDSHEMSGVTTPYDLGFDTVLADYINHQIAGISIDLNGAGEAYQELDLYENHINENVAIYSPVLEGVELSLKIQSGANTSNTIDVKYEYLRLGNIGMKSANVLTKLDATQVIGDVNYAIEKVSEQRAVFGSYMNRLQHAHDVNGISSENMQNSESKIRDADMAAEMVKYTKHNILAQAGQAILAQANQSPNGILTLLG